MSDDPTPEEIEAAEAGDAGAVDEAATAAPEPGLDQLVDAMQLAEDAVDAADLNPTTLAEMLEELPREPLVKDISGPELEGAIRQAVDALGVEEEAVPPVIDIEPVELRAAVEALLLVAHRPMGVARLATCLPGTDEAFLTGMLEGLSHRYDLERRGWQLKRIGRGWQLLTRTELHPWVRRLDAKELPSKLSRSAMETLAIVAYRQPVTRGQIEDIRGVQCGPMLRQLMDLKMVQVLGRSEELLGRPLLYGTTDLFLERFGLGSLDDLPKQYEFGT